MITALGPRLGLGLRLDFGSQVWFVQYFSEKKVIVLYAGCRNPYGISSAETEIRLLLRSSFNKSTIGMMDVSPLRRLRQVKGPQIKKSKV